MRLRGIENPICIALLAGSFVVALAASWIDFGAQIDNYAYDFIFRVYRPKPWPTETILLAIDERTLNSVGGMQNIRAPLASGLALVAAAKPTTMAIDVILAEAGDRSASEQLERALRGAPKLVLSCELYPDGREWEEPRPEFARWAAAVGHVHAEPDPLDSISRALPLERIAGRDRRWALALEAYRVSRGLSILETPDDLQVGNARIPSRFADGRLMRIRYVPDNMPPIPRVSLNDLLAEPSLAARFVGKAVFVGVTAQTELRDRLLTPYSRGRYMPGVEIHANAYETIAQGRFLTDAPQWQVVGFALLLVVLAGLTYARLPGWQANATAVAILLAANFTPYLYFRRGTVFSYVTPVTAAWFSLVSAASYQYLVVRRRLGKAEADRSRYQQAMHFVTHEMRTPLTAIQGSSELMSRYSFTEEKRKQIAQLINSESKRLGRMIEIFLNVERLSAGQMELKRETFAAAPLVAACIERVRPLADRKQIRIALDPLPEDTLTGDRELMEYAIYNLLTNAVKYSPQNTDVTVFGARRDDRLTISVQDQGIGMDQKEVRKIFEKFYRTRRAEESGEVGTGIGLSIVEQIVHQHGGTIEVASRPGHGSCFTLRLPVSVSASVAE
jgi:signal transduction histidine kinase